MDTIKLQNAVELLNVLKSNEFLEVVKNVCYKKLKLYEINMDFILEEEFSESTIGTLLKVYLACKHD